MRCKEVRKLLVPFGDGDLDLPSQVAVAAHLKSCADCRTEYEALESSLRAFRELGGRIRPRPPRKDLAERICRAVERPSVERVPRFRPALAAAALFLLLAAFSAYLLWPLRTRRQRAPERIPPSGIAENVAPEVPPFPAWPKRVYVSDDRKEAAIREALFEARLEAAELAMMEEAKDEDPVPETQLTVAELYAQIPAIMLAAADHMHRDVGDDKEAAAKYRRIVKLFPESTEAKIAEARLAQLVLDDKEG